MNIKRLLPATLLLAMALFSGVQAQQTPNYPAVIDTLMARNFIDIRSLYVPLMNYGGGHAQFEKLLDDFSRAYAYYLQRRLKESAELFEKNQQEITQAAQSIAKVYETDSTRIHDEALKLMMRMKMQNSINSTNLDISMGRFTTGDMYINNATNALTVAKRNLDGGKPIEAIFFYRRAKQFSFQCFELYNIPLSSNYEKDISDNRNEIFKK